MVDLPIPARQRQSGFSLAELLVSILVTSLVLLGTLALLNFSSQVSRVQGHVTDMQQSLRIAQYDVVRTVRMAGRGPLPAGNLPNGFAVDVRNNVPEGETIGGAGTPGVLAGTDVLTVRGVFDTPIYSVQPAAAGSFQLDGAGGGTVTIQGRETILQNLQPLRDVIASGRPEALLLVSPESAGLYAVVELDPGTSNTANPAQVTVGFRTTGGTHTAGYGAFSPAGAGVFPPNLTSVAFVGVLEEYRFYVRDVRGVAPDGGPELVPKLSRARVYPGTNVPWADNLQSWQTDIADNILDVQVALGMDAPVNGCTVQQDEVNCSIAESANGQNDDWLFNSDRDVAAGWAGLPLHFVRLTTLARTDRRDLKYRAPVLVRLEDHDFAGSPLNDAQERMFRRRVLQTVIDMRNL
jgi:type II secretory pathway pseudopilin PulG